MQMNTLLANILAADKRPCNSAIIIIPWPYRLILEAVLISTAIVRLSRSPICELPGSAISPLPDALLLDVVASKPNQVKASSFQLVDNIILNGFCVDRGQVSAISLAVLLSVIPVLRVSAVVVAVVIILLPALIASAWCSRSCSCSCSCCSALLQRRSFFRPPIALQEDCMEANIWHSSV